MFVGGAQHIDAVGDSFDGYAAAGEAFDIVKAKSVEFHRSIASQ